MAREKTDIVTTATETESAAETAPASPGKSMVSAAVSAELHEAIESHRWANRMSKAKVVEEALTEWARARGLLGGE